MMDSKTEQLINFLLDDMPEYRREAASIPDRKILLRSLMNLRPPEIKLDSKFLELQDEFLSHEREIRGVIDSDTLPEILPGISLWQGDITRLKVGAIVNAANSKLLGCFIPCHRCIDNAIHSSAGLQLRDECYRLMLAQGHDEATGGAKITGAYNLPCDYVIHTVGPIVIGELTQRHCDELKSCYESCLELAEKNNIASLAFCCISTGEFHFPNDIAAKIAVDTVKKFFEDSAHLIRKIIFNVFKDSDYEIYRRELTA